MQNFRNYYQILGITRDATSSEIKKAYRQLARTYHPDVNPGDKTAEEQFKDINEAYSILSDPKMRSEYDQYSRFWKQKGFQNKSGIKVPGFRGFPDLGNRTATREKEDVDYNQFDDFNKFVDQLLGKRREVRTVSDFEPGEPEPEYRPGKTKVAYTVPRETRRDIEARLTLPLEKAYIGGMERLRLEDGRSIEVEMPAGMISGQRIRLRNQGIGGGDLYLKIRVLEHPLFKLQGWDIFCQIPITPSEAILGSEVEVPTLDGLVKIKIPAGVSSGKKLRLAGKGYLTGEGDRGDQLVEIQIVTPISISETERELYEKIRQIETYKPRKSLLESVNYPQN